MFRNFSWRASRGDEVRVASSLRATHHGRHLLFARNTPWAPPHHGRLPFARTWQGLPDNWRRAADAEGVEYFYNAKTKQSTYDRPEHLPRGWDTALDKKTGHVYYFNKKTKEVTWTSPHNDDGMRSRGVDSVRSEDLEFDDAPAPPQDAPPGFDAEKDSPET